MKEEGKRQQAEGKVKRQKRKIVLGVHRRARSLSTNQAIKAGVGHYAIGRRRRQQKKAGDEASSVGDMEIFSARMI
jgi:hypothetical protein